MTAIATYTPVSGTAPRRCGTGVRGVEKGASHGQFHGEYGASSGNTAVAVAMPARRVACQFGTNEPASFWNGPRLRSDFTAQVLGQVLAAQRAPGVTAYAAYRKSAPRTALLHDEAI